MADHFKPGELVRVAFGDTFIDAYVVRTTPGGVWVRGSEDFEYSKGIYTFYPPEHVKRSAAPKGPVLRRLPNAS